MASLSWRISARVFTTRSRPSPAISRSTGSPSIGHEDRRRLHVHDPRRVVAQRLALAAPGRLIDREVRLQARAGDLPGQGREMAPHRVQIRAGTLPGGRETARTDGDIAHGDHPGGRVRVGARGQRHRAEHRRFGAGGLHGDGGTPLEPIALPALELRGIDGERIIPDVEPARPERRRARRPLGGRLRRLPAGPSPPLHAAQAAIISAAKPEGLGKYVLMATFLLQTPRRHSRFSPRSAPTGSQVRAKPVLLTHVVRGQLEVTPTAARLHGKRTPLKLNGG